MEPECKIYRRFIKDIDNDDFEIYEEEKQIRESKDHKRRRKHRPLSIIVLCTEMNVNSSFAILRNHLSWTREKDSLLNCWQKFSQ